ncbi:MAG: hypothetical protein K5857_05080 [Lachnospiraceae bacterium]|nr:hypothetical protein [Lachnospiraceae bacterium]
MNDMSGSELLMAVGIALIVISIAAGIVSLFVFNHTGKKLKAKLEQEYGNNV